MKTPFALLVTLCMLITGCSSITDSPTKPHTHDVMATKTIEPSIKTVKSSHSFADTVERVLNAIEQRPLNLFATVDHAEGAKNAGLALAPSTLFIFGNPKGGTPLMTRNPQMGIVLPLKVHVYQEGATVMLSYSDIAKEALTYGLNINQQPIPNIVTMLDGLVTEVIAK